jgi:hypothetical protein
MSAVDLRAAAMTTLASGTARLRHQTFLDPPAPRLGRFLMTEEGVTDLTRRWTRTELETPAELDEWVARLRARSPWLGDDAREGEAERARPIAVYASRAHFLNIGGRWTAHDDRRLPARRRGPRDPLWIIEAGASGSAGRCVWQETRGSIAMGASGA